MHSSDVVSMMERAIDLAYAVCAAFPSSRYFILGEIIHNPEVNEQIRRLGIRNLVDRKSDIDVDDLTLEDVVIVPAFGAEVSLVAQIRRKGWYIIDATCGEVMHVWKRVRQYATDSVTSIIHGKAEHEETRATITQVLEGGGHYMVVRNLEEADAVCAYIRSGGDSDALAGKYRGASSPGFDPSRHLNRVGIANQTTMLSGETEEIQCRFSEATRAREGKRNAADSFQAFNTICRATQDRQDALRELLSEPLHALLVVGGYNSSNTSHLAETAKARIPTFLVSNAGRLESGERIFHYDRVRKEEVESHGWLPAGEIAIGITAGASCPNNLFEEVILRLFALCGAPREKVFNAAFKS